MAEDITAEVYFVPVAEELERRARVLRRRAIRLDPRNRERQRAYAAKLERAARLLKAEGSVPMQEYV